MQDVHPTREYIIISFNYFRILLLYNLPYLEFHDSIKRATSSYDISSFYRE